MKNILLTIILILNFSLLEAQKVKLSEEYNEDELIIWLQNDEDINAFSKELDFAYIKPKRLLSKRLNIWLVEYKPIKNTRKYDLDNIKKKSKVKHVQNNHKVKLRALTPNDSYYSKQWSLSNIRLPDAWDNHTTGGTTALSQEIVIAIIDGGFDLLHNDIPYWKNTMEVKGNGKDDDGNGYVDDYDGWNAYSSNGTIPSNEHGTHVTGISGAKGNNSRGIAGVNWNVKIMPIAGSSGNEATVVEAYSYVHEMRSLYNLTNGSKGAFVVVTNSSFGVDKGNPSDYPVWCSMYDELGKVGVLSCAATANANWDIEQVGDVPTRCSSDYLIAVTNTTSSNSKYTNAAYGKASIDLGASGTSIYSTIPGNKYKYLTGTSMATPHVAGVVALMYAAASNDFMYDVKSNPSQMALIVRDLLFKGAAYVSSLSGYVKYGKLDALNSLNNIGNVISPYKTMVEGQSISNNRTYKAAMINARNDVVNNGGNLIFDSQFLITIEKDFEVKLGGTFETK